MEDLRAKAKSYACPHCGVLAYPNFYNGSSRQRNICYKTKNGVLEFPLVKGKLISCCEGYFVTPYHSSEEEYLMAIKSYIAFFAPITPWIKEYFKEDFI